MRSIKIDLSESQYLALTARADELDKTPKDLILESLEVYGALPLDEGFNQRIRAHMRDILGFSSPDGLETFIRCILLENPVSSSKAPLAKQKSPSSIDSIDVLNFILRELEGGKEPLVVDVAERFGLEPLVLGRMIRLKTVSKRPPGRGGKSYRVYTAGLIEEIKSKIGEKNGRD